MLPCLVMVAVAVGIVAATGRVGAVVGALGCMLMIVVMMAAMGDAGGHNQCGHAEKDREN